LDFSEIEETKKGTYRGMNYQIDEKRPHTVLLQVGREKSGGDVWAVALFGEGERQSHG